MNTIDQPGEVRLDQSNLTDEATIQNGRKALERLANDRTWTDWLAVGAAVEIGRTASMREANTNKPVGSAYNKAFARWLARYGFDALDKHDRKRLDDCMKNRNAIEAWRSTLPVNKRAQWSHPATVWRHWKAATQVPATDTKPSPFAEMKASLAQLDEENARLKREIDRGGGDVWTSDDRPEDIAEIMAGRLTVSKLERTARAMLAIVKERKANQRPAGEMRTAP